MGPQAARKEILQGLHKSHSGLDKTLRTAQHKYHWEGIKNEVKTMIEKCETCFQHAPSKPYGQHILDKEPLTEMEPMFSVSADLWSSGISHHIAMIDRASGYVWHKQIRNLTTATVIETMKEWFKQVGNPKKLRSDGGPCFGSHEFDDYTKSEKIDHTLSTPENPRANGLAEKGIGLTKGLWEKCLLNREDYDTALQYHNNMLRTGGEMSPSQLFYKRELRLGELPSLFRKSEDLMEARRERERGQRDVRLRTQTARAHESFKLGEKVILQDRNSKIWKGEAIVIEVRPDGRSYKVDRQTDRKTGSQTDRQTYRQTDRQTEIQTDRQTGRQTDRQTDRQTVRQTDSPL